MKKIGILTYHYSINEGAMLQAYALQQVLKDIFFDFDIEIVNYELLKEKKGDFLFCFKKSQNMRALIKNLIHYYRLNKFKNEYFNLSKPKHINGDYSKRVKFLNEKKYDLIIVGSDEVWKVLPQEDFRKDPSSIYWLGPEINCLKVSFAASAHKTIYNQLSENQREFIIRALKEFKLISVRDEHTLNMIRSFLGKGYNNLPKLLDSTFLYDFSKEKVNIEKILLKNKVNLNSKIAIFAIENEKVSNWARKFLKDKNYQIISIGHYNKYADFNFFDQLNPLEWASMFKKCNFCLTDRFHGTAFSIKNTIPFITIDHLLMYKKFKSKTKQLLEEFGLMERLIDLSNNISYDYDEFANKMELSLKPFDGDKIEGILEQKKEKSLAFIENIRKLL